MICDNCMNFVEDGDEVTVRVLDTKEVIMVCKSCAFAYTSDDQGEIVE